MGLEDCDHLEGYRDMEAGAMVEFEHPEGRWIAHEVAYADEVATRAYMEIWQDHRTPECFRQLFEKSAVEGVAGDDGVVESTSLLRDSLEQDPDNVTFSGAVTVVSAVDPNIRGEMSIRFQIRRFGPAVSQLLTIETGATPTDFVALNTRIEQRVSAALSA